MGVDRDSGAEGQTRHWAQRLGVERHARDECAVRNAKSEEDDATRASVVSLERWRAIVACIRRLAGEYNSGAKRVVLRVVEQPGQRGVTIAAGGEGAPYLTAVLEDTLICSDGLDSSGVAHVREVRLRSDRDDDTTAAYVVQDWMQRL